MNDIWESWVSGKSVEDFLEDVDGAVAEGLFPDRRSAFVNFVEHALAQRAFAYWGAYGLDDGCSGTKLAEQLLAYAQDAEKRAKQARKLSVN